MEPSPAIDHAPPDPSLTRETEDALRVARAHALKILTAWVIASALVLSVLHSFGSSFGWPSGEHQVRGHVVEIREVPDGEVVFWEAEGPEGRVYWSNHLDEDHEWDLGDPVDGWITDDGRFYMKTGASWMGPTGGFVWLFVIAILLFVARRVIGIIVALWDLRTGRDQPRRGYAALIENPIPRTWRPLIVIWWKDPTATEKAPFPDLPLLADDVTGGDLLSEGAMKTMEADVDQGRMRWMKPRWVAVKGGVLVPHRRALLAGALSMTQTRGRTTEQPVRLSSSGGAGELGPNSADRWSDRLPAMVLIRVAAVAALAAMSFVIAQGYPVTPA